MKDYLDASVSGSYGNENEKLDLARSVHSLVEMRVSEATAGGDLGAYSSDAVICN